MAVIVFEGHGGLIPSTAHPICTVPEGSVIYFFTEGLKGLLREDIENTLLNATAAELAQIEIHASRTIVGGSGVFNYTLAPDVATQDYSMYAESAYLRGITLVTVDGRTLLSDLFNFYGPGHKYYWLACSTVRLEPTMGEMLGVNTPQPSYGSEHPGQWDTDTKHRDFRPQGVCATQCPYNGCRSVCRHIKNHQSIRPKHRCHHGHNWDVYVPPNPLFNRPGNVTPGYEQGSD
ncbi:putative adhesin [Streptomyces sp. IBSNAI002]|uniref:putative adhesin n=1 Tax=Streptomyces sp. IBSNAI002 TaxID=3457500 RepID=UPI003FD54556